MQILTTAEQWSQLYEYMNSKVERFAFMFAQDEGQGRFRVVHMRLLSPADYEYQSVGGIELADRIRPEVIMHAHNGNFAIIEAHNHFGMNWPAAFSSIDIEGLKNIAPHMLWRLPGRPYAALVLAEDSFDGLVWVKEDEPTGIESMRVEDRLTLPTGISIRCLKDDSYGRR